MTLEKILEDCPRNAIIGDNLIRAYAKINSPLYKKIACKISGGSDSDIMLDIIWRCDKDNKVDYFWFDTGLEYQATKEHLKYLEEKYSIVIKPYKALKPIPLACNQYGQPFLSKRVSDYVSRLQRHNFIFKDESYEELIELYPRCQSALKWWCNESKSNAFNICKNKWLKEFMTMYPPTFHISDKCCKYAKKDVGNKLMKDNLYNLDIIGIRKAEGGNRSTAYKSCFDESGKGYDNYRPLFWYKNSDKIDYENAYNIIHSKCYTDYMLKRTGCAGCPFGRDFEYELEVIQKYEPKLFVAVNNIFKDSYQYTRQYREFAKIMNQMEKETVTE